MCAYLNRVAGVDADDVLNLRFHALDIGGLSGTTWNALRNKMRMGCLVLRVSP